MNKECSGVTATAFAQRLESLANILLAVVVLMKHGNAYKLVVKVQSVIAAD